MKWIVSLMFTLLAAQIAAADNMPSIQNIPLNDINGKPTSLKDYAGKVVLLVNVASQCGFTPQYKGLEALYEKYKSQGLVIIGVPCNDFGGQEPGSADEIKKFCTEKYNVAFPLMAKVHVIGSEAHPLYAALTGKESPFPGAIKWNFTKFVIGRDGKVVQRFESKITPEAPELGQTVETALAAK